MTSYLEDAPVVTDRLLVERHLAGNESAFGELYRRHYDRLVRFLRVRVYERELAEDLAQEAFARALAALEGLRDPARFYPWLTVIARHLVVHHHRTTSRLCLLADVEGVSTADAPDSRLLRRQDEADVQLALERVRVRHREILEMRERDELSYEDIALRLGTPATTVAPLLFRARAAFRREYLLVTEGDRKAVLLFPGLVDAWRRLRTRAGQYAAWLPDANAFCASAACIALGAGILIAHSHEPTDKPAETVLDGAVTTLDPGSVPSPAQRSDAHAPVWTRTDGRTSVDRPPPSKVVQGLAEVNIDNPRRTNWNRERARDMPIYFEVGPAGFAADPQQMQRDIESTLAGDAEWLEGS